MAGKGASSKPRGWHREMDAQMHIRGYAGFVRFLAISGGVAAVILLLMAVLLV